MAFNNLMIQLVCEARGLLANAPTSSSVADIKRHAFTGIGKPEPLQGTLAGWWSRRITGEHRLVYRVVGKGAARELHIAQCRYHY